MLKGNSLANCRPSVSALTVMTTDDETLETNPQWYFIDREEMYGEDGILARLVQYVCGTREAYPEPSPSRQH